MIGSRFIAELRRRRVLPIAGAYIAGAWAGVEIFSFLFEQFQAPDWASRLMAIIFVVGFPISMVLAWVIQVNEEGRWEIDPSRGDNRTLAVAIVVGILITAGLSWLVLPQRVPPRVYAPMPASLAVLPFASADTTLSENTELNRLYHALVLGLEQSRELTMVHLGPVEMDDDPVTYGRSLGVGNLVSGLLRASPQGGALEIQVLDVVSGEVRWSHTFAWDINQFVQTASTAANGVLQSMALQPLDERQFAGTGNRDAYLAFLDGSTKASVLEPDQLIGATGDFQTAIDLDPGYALAYLGLAQTLYDLADTDSLAESNADELRQRASKAVDMARRIDPDSAAAVSLSALSLDNAQLRIQAWERALELNPDHVMSYYRYAKQLQENGRLEEAERLIRRAVTLSPMDTRLRAELDEILRLKASNDSNMGAARDN